MHQAISSVILEMNFSEQANMVKNNFQVSTCSWESNIPHPKFVWRKSLKKIISSLPKYSQLLLSSGQLWWAETADPSPVLNCSVFSWDKFVTWYLLKMISIKT